MQSHQAAIRALLQSVATRTAEQPKMHTLKLIHFAFYHEYLHHLLDGLETANDTLQTLHFARTNRPHPFIGTTPQTIDLRPLLYQLPPLFTNLRDVQVADRVAVPGIDGANVVIALWLPHWQKLNFANIRIGVLYVNVDFSDATNLNALRAHVGDVLPEHAFNVHLQHEQQDGRFYIHYIYTSEHINGTFTVQYTREEDEEQLESMDEDEEEENGDIDDYVDPDPEHNNEHVTAAADV